MTPELEALERLLPCPFCGCAEVLYSPPCNDVEPDDFVLNGWQISCRNRDCGVVGPTFEDEDKAAAHWNTRADSKPLPWLRAEEVTEPGPYLMWHPFFPKEVSAIEIIVVNDALYVGEVFNTDDSPLLGGPKGVRYQGPLKPELPKEES